VTLFLLIMALIAEPSLCAELPADRSVNPLCDEQTMKLGDNYAPRVVGFLWKPSALPRGQRGLKAVGRAQH